MAIAIHELLQSLPEHPVEALGVVIGRLAANEEEKFGDGDFRIVVLAIEAIAKRGKVDLAKPTIIHDTWLKKTNHYKPIIKKLIEDHELSLIQFAINSELDRSVAERQAEPGFAVLTPSEKTAILQRVETIRQLIEGSGLLQKKRNALFSKLSALAEEVARDGTRTDALFSFLGELALTSGLMAKNAKPAIDEAKEITKIIVGSRSKREGISLQSPGDILQLLGPSDE